MTTDDELKLVRALQEHVVALRNELRSIANICRDQPKAAPQLCLQVATTAVAKSRRRFPRLEK